MHTPMSLKSTHLSEKISGNMITGTPNNSVANTKPAHAGGMLVTFNTGQTQRSAHGPRPTVITGTVIAQVQRGHEPRARPPPAQHMHSEQVLPVTHRSYLLQAHHPHNFVHSSRLPYETGRP